MLPSTINLVHLSDVFNLLGRHLFGSRWDGYEIWGNKSEDPQRKIDARKPLEDRLEETFVVLREKQSELKKVISKKEIQNLNSDILNLKREQSDIYADLHDIGEVEKFSVTDHGRWKRFETTEGYLLRAFRNGDLTVQCFMGMNVNPRLWSEMPQGFGYDLELSLIFLPERESSKRVNSARVDINSFETWLYNITPEHADVTADIPVEQRAQIWLREQVKDWDGREKRDSFMERAENEFPELSQRGFKRIWDQEATKAMKAPGPKKPQ